MAKVYLHPAVIAANKTWQVEAETQRLAMPVRNVVRLVSHEEWLREEQPPDPALSRELP